MWKLLQPQVYDYKFRDHHAVIITGTIDPHSTPEHPVLNIESIVIE